MNFWLNRFQIILFLFAAAMLTGCGKVSDSQVRTSSGMAGGFGGAACADGTSAIGEVYNSSGSSEEMTRLAQGLVSATLAPASLGTVPARGGIELELRLPKSVLASGGMGAINLPSSPGSSASRISLHIKDSWTGTIDKTTNKPLPPYPVSVSNISSVGRNMFGQYEVVFADQYGSMTLAFTSTGQQLTGTISYQNSVHIEGKVPASGVLGAFSIPACGVFY